jgi:DNA-directed RNA polymerase specialized sigma24 family protein
VEEIESLVRRATGAAPTERLAAFGELVERFQDMAYGCAYSILGDFHLAEDAAQEAFLAAYRGLDRLRGRMRSLAGCGGSSSASAAVRWPPARRRP